MADKIIVWFDIDNTLYSRGSGIIELMGKRIHDYFVGLGLSDAEAHKLHMEYYTQYGLAIRGLAQHRAIDPLDFDAKCDGGLPLDTILQPTPALSRLFDDIDVSKARIWALTNAYKTHAGRVLSLLGIAHHFESIIYCNYEDPNFSCKPEPQFYESALAAAGSSNTSQCYFIDDSLVNVRAAKALGWKSCVYYQELLDPKTTPATPQSVGVDHVVHSLDELRSVWPEVFRPTLDETSA
ncbi:pyrimidine 5-nucleotidase [Clavulina sp. PMI_390]|nr:pyrimidine 5-nucleotidase [Clavulina sp. PMI_390]